MPLTHDAYLKGLITTSMVDLLSSARQKVNKTAFARDEEMLVTWCRELGYHEVKRALVYWVAEQSRQRDERRHEDMHRERRLNLFTDEDEMLQVHGQLDKVNGAIVADELNRLERALYRQDQASGSKRTSGQRRADALVQMAMRSKAMPPGSRAPRVLISVLTGHEDFTQLCELANGVRVAPGQVVPLLGLADIEHIAFDGRKRAITATTQRSFTGALRRAIEVRDRHCQHPCGCAIPATDCDIDHIKPHSHGGRTSQENGRVLCSTHNRNSVLRSRSPEPHPAVVRARRRLCQLASDDDDHHR
jgi:5-methylcytosine-specific restriction endonuclease McrA